MAKTFFIPNKQSILGEQEILTAKSILGLADSLSHIAMMQSISVSLLTVSSMYRVCDSRAITISL